MIIANEQKTNFAFMSDKGISVFRAGIFILLSFFSLNGSSQGTKQNNEIIKIEATDTLEYIPSWYYGALDYNLMIAASKGLSSEIDRLIELGANINAYTNEGVTPLVLAVYNNHPETVNKLLKHFPDLDNMTAGSETPLLIAVKNDSREIAETLIRGGAQIDLPDFYGNTPLHYASLFGYHEMADILMYYDAPVNEKNDEGITPLHTAIWAGNTDIADMLIQNGANMEARDDEGYTPFLIAASFGNTLIMDMLYGYGVDIHARNNYNHNALTLSIAFDHKEAVTYLLSKSERWKGAASLGNDPYKVATKYRRKEIAAILKENNIPGRIEIEPDQVSVSGSARFMGNDFLSGVNLSVKEPYLNAGITSGVDMKLWYTRILVENSENIYTQYFDKGAMVYTGIFKDFNLTDRNNRGNLQLSASLSGAYTFGNKFKGTLISPDNSFKMIPAVSLKWTMKAISVFSGAEYIKTEYYKIGPVWFRAGISYNYYFDNLRPGLKKIKWK